MKLKQLGSNMTLLQKPNNAICEELLFSYETPVAGYDIDGFFVTDKKFSVTTSKHIGKYLAANMCDKAKARTLTQTEIEQKASA